MAAKTGLFQPPLYLLDLRYLAQAAAERTDLAERARNRRADLSPPLGAEETLERSWKF